MDVLVVWAESGLESWAGCMSGIYPAGLDFAGWLVDPATVLTASSSLTWSHEGGQCQRSHESIDSDKIKRLVPGRSNGETD